MASIFLFLISAITAFLLFLSPTNAALILTLNRQPIINGEAYNILPYGNHGLLTTAPLNNNSPCPRYINETRDSWPLQLGFPVTISSDSKSQFLSTRHRIEFTFYEHFPICDKSLRWWVAPKDSNGDQYVIVGTDGPFKSSYFFKIVKDQKVELGYNIKFCHVLDFSDFGRLAVVSEECNDVGFLSNGRLGLTPNNPFPVQFLGFAPKLNSS